MTKDIFAVFVKQGTLAYSKSVSNSSYKLSRRRTTFIVWNGNNLQNGIKKSDDQHKPDTLVH